MSNAKPLSDAAVQGLMEWPVKLLGDYLHCASCLAQVSAAGRGLETPHTPLCRSVQKNACLAELLEGRARLARVRLIGERVQGLPNPHRVNPLGPSAPCGCSLCGVLTDIRDVLDAPVDRTGEK